MKKENNKRKVPYETAEVELVLFEFSDIVTASGATGGTTTDKEDWGDWTD